MRGPRETVGKRGPARRSRSLPGARAAGRLRAWGWRWRRKPGLDNAHDLRDSEVPNPCAHLVASSRPSTLHSTLKGGTWAQERQALQPMASRTVDLEPSQKEAPAGGRSGSHPRLQGGGECLQRLRGCPPGPYFAASHGGRNRGSSLAAESRSRDGEGWRRIGRPGGRARTDSCWLNGEKEERGMLRTEKGCCPLLLSQGGGILMGIIAFTCVHMIRKPLILYSFPLTSFIQQVFIEHLPCAKHG